MNGIQSLIIILKKEYFNFVPIIISLIRACVSNEMLERGSSVRGEEGGGYSSKFSVGMCRLVL